MNTTMSLRISRKMKGEIEKYAEEQEAPVAQIVKKLIYDLLAGDITLDFSDWDKEQMKSRRRKGGHIE